MRRKRQSEKLSHEIAKTTDTSSDDNTWIWSNKTIRIADESCFVELLMKFNSSHPFAFIQSTKLLMLMFQLVKFSYIIMHDASWSGKTKLWWRKVLWIMEECWSLSFMCENGNGRKNLALFEIKISILCVWMNGEDV
jgi:hypothetical protein